MNYLLVFSLLLIFNCCSDVFAKNILFISPVPSPSHHIFNRILALGLVEKGYNVTFVSADPPKSKVENLHYIHLEKVYELMEKEFNGEKMLEYADMPQMIGFLTMPFLCHMFYEGVFASKGLQTILDYSDDFKFEAVLYDSTFGPALLPLVTKFRNPPLIAVTPFVNSVWTLETVASHKYPAYIPHYGLPYSTSMNFFQRMWNALHYVADYKTRDYCFRKRVEPEMRNQYKFSFPPLEELMLQSKIYLINADISIDHPEPTPPNMVLVGGLQIASPKNISQNMEKFIAAGRKGTILMSLGTNIKSSYLGNETLEVFLRTFEAFPEYNFIWKFETDEKNLPVKPAANVMIGKFLPQNDILAHPNVKAFVSHCGLLSTHEAYWYGVPMVCLPFFVDQHSNAKKSVDFEVAVKSHYKHLTVEEFKSLISQITTQKYAENAKKISKLFRDKPQKPLEKAIWWIEYVMRNSENLQNLRSPTIELGFFASNSYDIILTVIITLHLIVFFMVKFIKKLFIPKSKKTKRE